MRDDEDALWALEQDYTGPDGRRRTRHGFFARVAVEEYGPGRIRPHERTHPGPKEDRLRLTRATHANLSPIFSLYDDPAGAAWGALAPHLQSEPWAEVSDEDGTVHRLWRVADPAAIEAVRGALADKELLIADGHHRYETARVHHEEGGAGHVLMCLVALQDPGLTVFPTHRLLTGLDGERRESLRATIQRDFTSPRWPPTRSSRPATVPCGWATSTPATAARCCSHCAIRRSPRRRCRTSPSPTEHSTPRCLRRWSCRARWG